MSRKLIVGAMLAALIVLLLGWMVGAQQPVTVASGNIDPVGGSGVIRISTGVAEDEFAVKTAPGLLLGVSAYNLDAATNAFVRCTDATVAGTTPGSTPLIYNMAIPYGGLGFVDRPLNIAFTTALTCYLVTDEASTGVTEVVANKVGVNVTVR